MGKPWVCLSNRGLTFVLGCAGFIRLATQLLLAALTVGPNPPSIPVGQVYQGAMAFKTLCGPEWMKSLADALAPHSVSLQSLTSMRRDARLIQEMVTLITLDWTWGGIFTLASQAMQQSIITEPLARFLEFLFYSECISACMPSVVSHSESGALQPYSTSRGHVVTL